MNKAILSGHLGKDPELRHTKSGTAVCDFSLATSDREKVNGEWKDTTEWHTIVVWGKTAENVDRFCSKGSKVLVEGRIRSEKWQDKDGNNRSTTKIVADRVEFLSPRAPSGQPGPQDSEGGYSEGFRAAGPDDDIPF